METKIDYTNYLTGKPKLEDAEKKASYFSLIRIAMQASGLKGRVHVNYFLDAAAVYLNNNFYGMWSYKNARFFGGAVGDYRPLTERG